MRSSFANLDGHEEPRNCELPYRLDEPLYKAIQKQVEQSEFYLNLASSSEFASHKYTLGETAIKFH